MSGKKWIRLNTDYADSQWMAGLHPDVRRLWPDLLCYVKASGTAGRVKVVPYARIAQKIDTTEAKARTLFEAALVPGEDGEPAIEVINGHWVFLNWSKWQDPMLQNAERQRDYRRRRRDKLVSELKVIDGDFGREDSA
jgi:hypothetical protein